MGGRRFADLLDKASLVDPEIRFRFTSPHPKASRSLSVDLKTEDVTISFDLIHSGLSHGSVGIDTGSIQYLQIDTPARPIG